MQYIFHAASDLPGLAAIEESIAALDPAVVLDTDLTGRAIRISTAVTEAELRACLQRAGVAEVPELKRVPSECCGGCGG